MGLVSGIRKKPSVESAKASFKLMVITGFADPDPEPDP
jgi:hypothetical protein